MIEWRISKGWLLTCIFRCWSSGRRRFAQLPAWRSCWGWQTFLTGSCGSVACDCSSPTTPRLRPHWAPTAPHATLPNLTAWRYWKVEQATYQRLLLSYSRVAMVLSIVSSRIPAIDEEWQRTQCMPRETCVDVAKELGTDPSMFFKPPCVSVYRFV